MSILKEIVEKNHFVIIDESITWQDAVKLSTQSLVKDGCVEDYYYKQIVECIEKYGPYVVFDYEAAMPHSTENADGVNQTSIGLLINKQLISFGKDCDGEEKNAKILFTLASSDSTKHMENIKALAGILMNEQLLNALKTANSGQDILDAEIKFPCEEF